MPTNGSTPNFGLVLPYSNRQNWTDLANNNFRILDALTATYVSVTSLKGIWQNAFVYAIGDNVVDSTSGVVYTAQVSHTSSSQPTTFIQERAAHPTYWLAFSTAARNRGAWAASTPYALNDFVVNGSKYAVCVQAHTSSSNFDTDVAAGKWDILVDLSAAGSLVLPVLSGLGDANKFVITNAAGTAYIVATAADVRAIIASSIGAQIMTAANAATVRTLISAQTLDATLTALSGQTTAAYGIGLLAALSASALGSSLALSQFSAPVQNYLAIDASVAVSGAFVSGPNTGAIGAAGQTWLIFSRGTFQNTFGGNMTATLRLNNGALDIDNTSFSLTTGFEDSVFLFQVAALTAPTTFTLQATDNVGGNLGVLKASSIGGAPNKATFIAAVRIK